jgi:sugar-phosphatase
LELRCQAFLFDLDGVLVDSQAVVERTWRRWAQRHDLDPDTLIQTAHGRRTRDTVAAVTPDVAIDREVAWLDAAELADVDGLRVVPGAKQLLSLLPRHRWAVVTSCGGALARLRLTAVGLPLPGVLVVSEDVKHGKPAPDGYRLAADRLRVDAAACVVFEDAPAGVAAGRAAGARVIGLTTSYLALDLADTEATIPDFISIDVLPDHDALVLTVRE